MLFWTRFFTGIAKANTIPVQGSLIADAYPIGVRARMSAAMQGASHALGLVSPVLVAAIADIAGGQQGWRWAWYLLGIPVSLVAIGAFFMKEPPRGQFEKDHVLHEVVEEEHPAPISMEAAFARLKKIATIRTVLVAFCALGFGLFSQATLASLYLNNDLHVTNVLHRGIILTLSGVGALPLLPFVGKYFDRAYRKDPARALAVVGLLILPVGHLHPAAVLDPQRDLVRHPRHPPGRSHHRRPSPWWDRSSTPWSPTGCGAWAPPSPPCTSSSSVASPAGSSPASSPMPSASATPSSCSVFPPASSAGSCS